MTVIVVGNDGAPFRLADERVRDAVCRLDRSTKSRGQGFVGHMGIGLKSVILKGRGYSVRSRGDGGEVLRVAFLEVRHLEGCGKLVPAGGEAAGKLRLVRLEKQGTTVDGRYQRSSRVLLWRERGEEAGLEDAPPAARQRAGLPGGQRRDG